MGTTILTAAEGQKIHVLIRTRSKLLFEGDVYSLTSYNDLGVFDVIPLHANFVTLIKDKVILNKGQEDEQIFETTKGLLNVTTNKVEAYFGL